MWTDRECCRTRRPKELRVIAKKPNWPQEGSYSGSTIWTVRERSDLYWMAGLAALITLLFADILLLGNSLYFRDIAREYYPTRRIFHDVIRAGEFPFWNPRYGGGQPFAANPGYETFYPIGWLTLLLPNFDLGFRLEVILHYYIAAFAMYLFLRSCSLRPAASGLGAISWSIGGMLASFANLLPLLFACAWLPLLALFTRRFFRDYHPRDFAFSAIVLGVILTCGDQSMILQSGALVVVYALFVAVKTKQNVIRAFALSAGICAAGLLVGAVQIIPALEHQRESARGIPLGRGEVMSWSMHPTKVLDMVFAEIFGRYSTDVSFYWASRFHPPFPDPFTLSFYPGLLMTGFIIAGFIRRTRGWQIAAILAGLSYLAAIGWRGPIFPLLYSLGMRSVRYPEKFWISGVFALTVFAAFALDDTLRTARAARVTFALIAVVAGAIAIVSLLPLYDQMFESLWGLGGVALEESKIGWRVTLVVAAICALLTSFHERRMWAAAAAVVLIADLAPRLNGLIARLPPSYYEPPALARALRPGDRLFNFADWQWLLEQPKVPSPLRPWFIRNALAPRSYATWGFHGVIDLDITRTDLLPTLDLTNTFWRLFASGEHERVALLLKLAGATHSIEPLPLSQWVNRNDPEQMQPAVINRIRDAERYYFADQIVVTPNVEGFMSRMRERTSWSRRVAFVDSAAKGGAPGKIVSVRERTNSIALDVIADGDALLVIGVTPHKYWRVTLDGQRIQPHRANLGFQAVPMTKGRHRIEMKYRNDLIVACGIVSALTLAVLLWRAGVPARSSRASRPAAT